ncbi:protein of unknown function [Rhizobiales bacterium GAS191]|nr:protein of unknown function [Rhizobiales bacterium GAS191]
MHTSNRNSPTALAVLAALAIASATFVVAEETATAGSAMAQTISAGAENSEAAFLDENNAALTKMMNAMAVKPTGDIDHDFVAMMEPHHQGAIDMAQAELRYGKNEQLRRIAQEIVVEQQQEIVAMRLALGEPLPPPFASPTQVPPIRPSPTPTDDMASMSRGSMRMSPSMTKMK